MMVYLNFQDEFTGEVVPSKKPKMNSENNGVDGEEPPPKKLTTEEITRMMLDCKRQIEERKKQLNVTKIT